MSVWEWLHQRVYGSRDEEAPVYPSDENRAELIAALVAANPLPPIELPPYVPLPHCPKCDFLDASVSWHDGMHPHCPDERLATYAYDASITLFVPHWESQGVLVERARKENAAVEHLDRICQRCGFGWAEATVDRGGRIGDARG